MASPLPDAGSSGGSVWATRAWKSPIAGEWTGQIASRRAATGHWSPLMTVPSESPQGGIVGAVRGGIVERLRAADQPDPDLPRDCALPRGPDQSERLGESPTPRLAVAGEHPAGVETVELRQ